METRNYIGGQWVASRQMFESYCPDTGAVLGVAPRSTPDDVERAVEAAKAAFPAWSKTPIAQRAQYVLKAAEALTQEYGNIGEATPLKQLIRDEMGKRLSEADIEVVESSDMLRFFAEQGPHSLADRPIALSRELWPTKRSSVNFSPLGVVGVIKPWNYPLELPLWSIGAALVAGNTVVFKPSEITPFVGSKVVELFERAGLPSGILNMVTGDRVAGAALVDNHAVDMISFTGSTSVGKEIALRCAARLCRVSLELGGKDAMVVLDDADLELAVNGALWGAFTNCGQVCVGVRRLLLSGAIREAFLERLVESTCKLRLGADIAPLASVAQLEKVQAHVEDALRKGAHALCGARRPEASARAKGYFFEPTILEHTNATMLVEQDDTFGPVVIVRDFSTDDEAVTIANSTDYDLGASVWTSDPIRAIGLAKRLNVGMVWINDVNVAFPQAPWCGRRLSGHGIELSEFAFQEYSALKHVCCETGDEKRRPWWFPYV